ncbi:MAG: hypothetical protein ACUVYA_05890 [Planctomycetota bacterium]
MRFHRIFRLFAFASLLGVVSAFPGASGAESGLSLRLVPSADVVSTCGESFEVTLELSNPSEIEIGGYQAFLRFPAAAFDALRFDAVSVNGLVQTAGPSPLGNGFRPCDGAPEDGWADGAGEDVVAVVATAFSAGSSTPFRAATAELGRFVFRPKAGAPASAVFRLNEDACRAGFDSATRIFDPSGNVLPFAGPGTLEVPIDASSPQVRAFACQEVGTSVFLSWVAPAAGEYMGFRVYRDGATIATLPLKSILSWEDRSPPEGATIVYRLVILLQGFQEGCGTTCTVERGGAVRFVRGDANRDGSVNLSDAIAILDHLFRGNPLTCEDAGDVDDSGSLNLTDAIGLLGYLFRSGAEPSPPFPTAGTDPTPDGLSPCSP